MDAGLIGGLIGLGIMVAGVICMKLENLWSQRRRITIQKALPKKTPLLIVRRHSKMNMLLPK
jgi:hypothetical protein